MVDDWINTSFQPKKTSASIWFGVIYGVYKPLSILLVATLSSEIFKKDIRRKKGVLQRVCEIIRGRKRPPVVLSQNCIEKLKGIFITPEVLAEVGGDNAKGGVLTVPPENNNGNVVYKGIKAVKIRAKIKQMEISNGQLTVFAHTTVTPAEGKQDEKECVVCGSPTRKAKAGDKAGNSDEDDEKVHELHLFQPCSPLDNETGMMLEDMYPEETDDEEEDEDELEEVLDEDDDESDEDEDNEQCVHPDHKRNIRECQRQCDDPECIEEDAAAGGSTKEMIPSDLVMITETTKSGSASKNLQSGLSLIAYSGNDIQGNLMHGSNSRVTTNGQGDGLLHGSIVDGANLHI